MVVWGTSMKVIRGATTVEKDSKEEILSAVKDLLDEVFATNALQKNDVTAFVFSLTADIHSYHPAKAAREAGYDFAPLFAAIEPQIDGGLTQCIRLMLLTDLDKKQTVKHIYQKGAKILRTDISEIINIALDGPAGSGKSTIAKILAQDYNILYLDTGAMYRATALKALSLGIDTLDAEGVKTFIDDINLEIKYINNYQHVFVNGKDYYNNLRENQITKP